MADGPLLAPGEPAPCELPEAQVQKWLPVCRALPKCELHAHINGSVRDATIEELAALGAQPLDDASQALLRHVGAISLLLPPPPPPRGKLLRLSSAARDDATTSHDRPAGRAQPPPVAPSARACRPALAGGLLPRF